MLEQPNGDARNEVRPTRFPIRVPDEHEGGTYANFVNVWSTAFEFTLDFCATQPPVPPEDVEDPDDPDIIPCTVVSRVRIPATLIYQLFRTLDENLDRYEKAWGEIREPWEEPEPPEEEE